jgi:hypothetical protein
VASFTGSVCSAIATAAVEGAAMIEGAAARIKTSRDLRRVFNKPFATKNKMPS